MQQMNKGAFFITHNSVSDGGPSNKSKCVSGSRKAPGGPQYHEAVRFCDAITRERNLV